MLTPIYKYAIDNWIWVWLKTPEKCSKNSGSKIEFQLLSHQSKIQWVVNGWIIREPNSYGRTTDLSKTLLVRPMLTPICKYAIDNWIWV